MAVTPDATETIARAVRGLRIRNILVTLAFVALCGLLVAAGHMANTRFSNATNMAQLTAQAAELADRIAYNARQLADPDATISETAERALNVQAERIDDLVQRTSGLWQQLDEELKVQLTVDSLFGEAKPVQLLAELRGKVEEAAVGGPTERATNGNYLEGFISLAVKPALATQAETLRRLNRTFADNTKIAINAVGTFFWLFAAAILFFSSCPWSAL